MKRLYFLRHLKENGCVLLREGAKHSVFLNPSENRVSTVPRHREVNDFLCRKIYKDLQIHSW